VTFNVLPGGTLGPSQYLKSESLQLPGSRHGLFRDGLSGQWRLKCGRMSSMPEECPAARVVNSSVWHFVKSLLRCKDCQISPQLANACNLSRSEREGVLCPVGKVSGCPSSPSKLGSMNHFTGADKAGQSIVVLLSQYLC